MPDGKSFVSLIDFYRRPMGNLGCGSVVKMSLKSGWGPYFGVSSEKIPPVPIVAVCCASASSALRFASSAFFASAASPVSAASSLAFYSSFSFFLSFYS